MKRPLAVGLIGPLPPPSGGMANQTRQLAELLGREGIGVTLIRTNADYRPRWVGGVRGVRAAFRLVPYLVRLWRAAGGVDVFHVMANSGWAWYLYASPAIAIAKLRGVPVIVNYRGGGAETFFTRSAKLARYTLTRADAVITPSGFLQGVFQRMGVAARVVPNIVDLERFRPAGEATPSPRARIVVTRNLEPIYDIPTALRAFALVRREIPRAHLTIAGSGPELTPLRRLAQELGVDDGVTFPGRVDNERMPLLYQSADVMFNPSRVDNMPISILEAYASGVPVVSTHVGGVPFIAEHGRTALLVEPGNAEAAARALVQILTDADLATRLARAGLEEARRYRWEAIRELWLSEYRLAAPRVFDFGGSGA